ncbi:MAG: glycogen/starch synthase [Patescibacteria group bacterium]|jgi:starch synthase
MAKKILFLSAEVAPFVKVGGLSQVMYFLPRALRRNGLDVRIFTPKYGTSKLADAAGKKLELQSDVQNLAVRSDDAESEKPLLCNVLALRERGADAPVYFLENREYYELRENVFGYIDDPTRFALLSRSCLEWLRIQKERLARGDKNAWWPDIVHCHDWHASYFIEMARRHPDYRELMKNTCIVLTVHNFRYQGVYDFRFMREEEKDDGEKPLAPIRSKELAGQNILLRGIRYADAVTTVSPTHAREILTPEYSEGLLAVLAQNQQKLHGILNGLDTEEFDPAVDKRIAKIYSSYTYFRRKEANKTDLQKAFGLPIDPNVPVIAFSGRLTSQKGIDLILEAAPRVFEARPDAQLVVLGTGDEQFRQGFTELKKHFPNNLGLHLFSNFELPRKIFAGADLMLIPSSFEPGGIIALEALRYGCVPLVRRTGGLNDIVTDFDPNSGEGNGFSFRERSAWALFGAIIEALAIHRQSTQWHRLVRNAMASVVTWDDAAEEYENWYERICTGRRPPLALTDRFSKILGKIFKADS